MRFLEIAGAFSMRMIMNIYFFIVNFNIKRTYLTI